MVVHASRRFGLLGFAISCCPGLATAAPIQGAYYEGAPSNASLATEASTLGIVAADQFAINARGQVTGTVPAGVFATASAHHIALLAVVSNFGKNGFMASIAKAVLTPGTVQTAAINNMVGIAGRGFAGINVDFESVPHTLRPQYTAFAQALATALHKAGSTLVLSLPATTVDNPNDSWTGAYDYAALAKIADTLQVMTYDENGPWGPPGPVAGLDWVTACLAYSQTVVPAAKISLGMPAYGYDWDTTQGTGVQVSYKAIPALLRATGAKAQWNAATSSPWFTYQASNGDAHTVWYENARSIQIKAALASAKNVASVSVYALGFDNAAFWQAVKAGLTGP